MAKMTIKDTAELIGVTAIVLSMAALAYELRETQEALLAQTYQERAFDAISEQLNTADSEFLLPVLVATDTGADAEAVAQLNDTDRLRLRQYMRARMADWDNEYFQYQHGYLDEDFFRTTTVRAIKNWAPRWRRLDIEEARDGFRQFVDEVLSDSQVGTIE